MIQRLATLLITLYISISLQAQDKKKPGFTKEEFRARQEAYLTQKAEITQEETTPVTTVAASRRNSPFTMLMTIHVSAPIKAAAITVFAKYPLLNLT